MKSEQLTVGQSVTNTFSGELGRHEELKKINDLKDLRFVAEEDDIDEASMAGGAGQYSSNFGTLRKNPALFRSNVKDHLMTKEQLLNSLNENKISVGKATEAYRNAGLLLQHFRKEQQAILDQFKTSEPEDKESIKPVLIYYHSIIKGLEGDLSAAEKEMEFAMGAEDDDLVMKHTAAETASGEYSQPSVWVPVDKANKPNISKMGHGKKPTWKGGKFVRVKKSCKTFPYCNQGDINALELTNRAKDITESIHKETGMDKKYIKSMIIKHMSGF